MERIKFLELNAFQSKRKCGVEVATAIGLGIAGLAGSMYASDRANSMQAGMNEKAMDWQSEEAEKARQYNTQEREAAQSYQSGQLNNLMRFQEQMQSPVYQSQQLRSAGINPAVYFSQHGTFAGGSAPSAPSAPQGASSPMPTASPSIHPVVPDWASSMAIGANISKTMAEAGHSKADTDLILQKVYGEELMNKDRELELQLKKMKAPASVMKAFQEVRVLQGQEFMAWMQGKEFQSKAKLEEEEAKIQKFIGDKASADAAYAQELITDLKATRDARLRVLRSESERNSAQAKESREHARVYGEEAEFKAFENELRRTNSKAYADSYVDNLYAQQAISQADYQEAVKRLRGLKFGENDKDVDDFLSWLKSKINMNVSASGSVVSK